MTFTLPASDFDFLQRVDSRLREGDTQHCIAEAEGLEGGAGSLHKRLNRLGFRTERRGGWHLETILGSQSFSALVERGELKPQAPVAV